MYTTTDTKKMNESSAIEIIGEYIADGNIPELQDNGDTYVFWEKGNKQITLDGKFTANELQAFVWLMEKAHTMTRYNDTHGLKIGDKVRIIADNNNTPAHAKDRGKDIGKITTITGFDFSYRFPVKTDYRDKNGWLMCFQFDEIEKI